MQDYVRNPIRREFVIRQSEGDPNALELYEPFYDDLHARVTFVYSENLKGERIFIEEESDEARDTLSHEDNHFLINARNDLAFCFALAQEMCAARDIDFTIAVDLRYETEREKNPDLFDEEEVS